MYYCMQLEIGEYWIYTNLNIRCWDSKHLLWSLLVGIPSMLVYVIGFPVLAFMILHKKRNLLED